MHFYDLEETNVGNSDWWIKKMIYAYCMFYVIEQILR